MLEGSHTAIHSASLCNPATRLAQELAPTDRQFVVYAATIGAWVVGNGSGAIIRRGVVAVTHADAFVGDHGYGAGGEVVGEVVEVFEGEVELLPGRLSVDVELN